MTTLSADKVIRFKNRLFQKNISRLMQKGAHDLNPLSTCKQDAKGNVIIPVQRIVDFFFKAVEKDEVVNSDTHLANLYTLFEVLTKGADDYSFESDISVSGKDIQEADNKTTIEHLTRNLIITYFNNVKLVSGKIDAELLDKDLNKIIKISCSGRDYQALVENTFMNLVQTLKQDQAWRKCFQNINGADLVCRLVGDRLPQVEKTVLSKFILQSRAEINKDNTLLSKILNARAQLIKEETNQKSFLKVMKKLDAATDAVLKKINDYLY